MTDPLPNLPTAIGKDLDELAYHFGFDKRAVVDGKLETDQQYRERITAFFYSAPEKDRG